MLDQAYSILREIFSERGFVVEGFEVRGRSPCSIKITVFDDKISIDFPENHPQCKINKIITFSLDILGIDLEKGRGIVKLKNFVDFPFTYG